MRSQSLDKSSYQIESSQPEDFTQFKFRILLGEFCLLKKVFDGQIVKPNIFADKGSMNLEKLCESDIADHTHVVSARCGNDPRIGITQSGNRIVYTYKIFNRMFVDVSGDYESYLSNFKKKSLSSLRRKIKKAEKSNTATTIQDFTSASQVREFVEIAKPISTQSYQEAQLGTVFRTDEEWIAQLETLARNNRFRGYVLYINDEPVAYNYCPIYGDGILLYDLSGYIPESNRYSPGTVLQAHIIERSFADDAIKIYDLCEGEGRHKEQFATGSNTCFNAYIFPKNAYYKTLVSAHRAMDQISDKIVAITERLGIKDKIKTFLRRRG